MTPEQLCKRYSDLLDKYPPDVVCLGIGNNGHIAFNDPHVAKFDDPEQVKIVDLDFVCRTQQVNDKCFESIEKVPEYAITLTVPALLKGSCLICTVPGKHKAQAVYNTINGPISESCPATALRLHKNAHMFLDIQSAEKL
jgi:glucosamine-6-phosphate deaminase